MMSFSLRRDARLSLRSRARAVYLARRSSLVILGLGDFCFFRGGCLGAGRLVSFILFVLKLLLPVFLSTPSLLMRCFLTLTTSLFLVDRIRLGC